MTVLCILLFTFLLIGVGFNPLLAFMLYFLLIALTRRYQ